jgi:hypothetical protein
MIDLTEECHPRQEGEYTEGCDEPHGVLRRDVANELDVDS